MRQKIMEIIEEMMETGRKPHDAAIQICKYLDEELDLSGNGWFDGDPVMLQALP